MAELKNINGPVNIVGELEATSLDINGNADISGNLSGVDTLTALNLVGTPVNASTHSLKLGRTDVSNYWYVNHAGNDFRLFNSASSGSHILFGVDASGNVKANNVGIGTPDPDQKLHVVGNFNLDGNADISGTTTLNNTVYFSSTGLITWGSFAGGNGFGIRGESGRALSLGSNGNFDHLVIDTGGDSTFAGDVTLGSNSLTAGSLDINGNANISGNLTMNNGGTIDQGTIYIQDQNGGRIGWNRNTSNGAIHNSSYNAFQAQVNTSGADGKFEIQGYTGAGGYGGSFLINVNAQPLINDYILHNGDENTKIGFSGSDTFIVHTGGTTALTVDSSQNATFTGNLAVSSDTTYDGIQISGASIPTLSITDTTNNAKLVAYARDSDAHIGTESNHTLSIDTNNTTALTISNSQTASFAGDVTINASLDIIRNSNNNQLKLKRNGSATGEFDIYTNTNTLFFKNVATNQIPLGIDGSNNATFAGNVDVGGGGIASSRFTARGSTDDSSAYALEAANSSGASIFYVRNDGLSTFAGDVAISSTMPKLTFTDLQQDDWRIMNDNGDFRFTNIDGSGHALVLAANNNATFTGDVKITTSESATTSTSLYLENTGSGGSEGVSIVFNPMFGATSMIASNREGADSGKTNLSFHTCVVNDASPIERMRLTSEGNLGIGTTSPTYKLAVAGKSYLSGGIQMNSGDEIDFGNSNQYITGVNDTSLTLATGGSATLTATHAGNVGIGTNSPGRKLTVAGSDNMVFLDSAGNSYLTIDRSAADRRSALVFSTDGDGTSAIPNNINWALGAADSDEVGDGTGFFIGTSTNATSSKLFIEQGGNVGIGTTSPAVAIDYGATTGKAFHLYTSSADYYGFNMTQYDGGAFSTNIFSGNNGEIKLRTASGTTTQTTRLTVKADGKIGIGTTSPGVKLEVSGDHIRLSDAYSLQWASANNRIYNQSNDTVFVNNASESFRITGGGNLQLAPTKKLYFDSGNHTYLTESTDNNLQIVTGGTITAQFAGTGLTLRNTQVNGTLYVGSNGNGNDVVFYGTTGDRYLHWDESQDRLELRNNVQIAWGNGIDLTIVHDGTDGAITNSTGDLYIRNYDDDKDIIFQSDNGTGGLDTYLRVDGTQHTIDIFKQTHFYDNVKATFGHGNDLQIYHDGSNSYISDQGVGSLKILAANFDLKNAADNASMIRAIDGGTVELYYGGAKKLETTSGGVSVTGAMTASGDVVAFSDKKLKENIETLDGKKVLDMRGVSFTRKDTGKESSGVIAQEIQKVAPELVHDTEGTLGVSYGNLVGYLIEAVKDQQKQIDELKAIINGSSK